jgi:hypothetical protein
MRMVFPWRDLMVSEVRERAGVLQGIYGENMVLRGGGGILGTSWLQDVYKHDSYRE